MTDRASLCVEPNLTEPDRFYAALLAAHEGRSEPSSARFNTRLVLLLANHIGDHDVLDEALKAAAQGDNTSVAIDAPEAKNRR